MKTKHVLTAITTVAFLFFFSDGFSQSGVTVAPKNKDEKKIAPKTGNSEVVKKTGSEESQKTAVLSEKEELERQRSAEYLQRKTAYEATRQNPK